MIARVKVAVEYRFFEPPRETEIGSKNRRKNLTEANPGETTFGSKIREFRKTEGLNNRDSAVF